MSRNFLRGSLARRSSAKAAALALGLALASAGAYSLQRDANVEAAVAAPATGAPAARFLRGGVETVAPVQGPSRVVTQGFADVVAKVTPAVVTIRTERTATPRMTQLPQFPEGFPFGDLFGDRVPRGGRQLPAPMQRGLGSGVIVTNDGYILTNNHVIEDAATIEVELSDRRVMVAKLIGADPPSDLAVLKIDGSNLPVVPIGDSNAMRVGDLVLAVGNPLGVGQTVTMGIVSAKGRATGLGNGSYEDFLQTDAPINQGNSGGALVNTAGELIGINSQIMSPSGGNIGIGFAVPSLMAKNVMDQLVVNGRVHRGLLGVTVQGVTGDLAAGLGLSKAEGAIVSNVTPGSAADKAGIKQGDVIVSYQGRPVIDTNTLRNEIAATKPGSPAKLEILRDGNKRELTATLEEAKVSPSGARSGEGEGERAGKFGMTVEPLTPELAARLEVARNVKGVVITDIDPAGAAAAAGLREGDVIQQVNGKSVDDAGDVRDALDANAGKPSVLLVTRGDATIFVPLRAR